jgi:hypothetical protein
MIRITLGVMRNFIFRPKELGFAATTECGLLTQNFILSHALNETHPITCGSHYCNAKRFPLHGVIKFLATAIGQVLGWN